MTVDANSSATGQPGSGSYPALRTPPDGTPALPPADPCGYGGISCAVVRSALVDGVLIVSERTDAARLRADHLRSRIGAWLALRGLSPTGDARPGLRP